MPRVSRPPDEATLDPEDYHDRQHLEHAGGGKRGLDLHGNHHGRILSGHGIRRGFDGGLDLTGGASVPEESFAQALMDDLDPSQSSAQYRHQGVTFQSRSLKTRCE